MANGGYSEAIETIFSKMEDFISSKTVVGDPIVMGETTLLPIIEVSVGVGAGGRGDKEGAGGMGAKIIPSAILVITKDNVRLVSVKNQDAIDRLIDMVPGAVSKLNFAGGFGKKNNSDEKETVDFEEKTVVE